MYHGQYLYTRQDMVDFMEHTVCIVSNNHRNIYTQHIIGLGSFLHSNLVTIIPYHPIVMPTPMSRQHKQQTAVAAV